MEDIQSWKKKGMYIGMVVRALFSALVLSILYILMHFAMLFNISAKYHIIYLNSI